MRQMNRPATISLVLSILGGLTNAAVVTGLLLYFDYPLVQTNAGIGALAVAAFCFGFVPLFVTAETKLLSPSIGFIVLLVGVTYVEVTTPSPKSVGQLGANNIVEGPFHIYNYADSWYLWLALLLAVGIGEFAIRRGYGVGDRRLSRVPDLPLSKTSSVLMIPGSGILLGGATALLISVSLGFSLTESLIIGSFVAVDTVLALTALLSTGIVTPFLLFVIWIPIVLRALVFGSPSGVAPLVVPGFLIILLAIAWLVEFIVRFRFRGWDGGQFGLR